MKRGKKYLGLIVALLLALVAAGCNGLGLGSGSDNSTTVTETRPDGTTVVTESKLSDAGKFTQDQVELEKARPPILRMKAKPGESIEMKGVESLEVYANSNAQLKQFIAAWERVIINGMPLIAMVAQGFIQADMAVKIAETVGATAANAGGKIYNITTQDGGPVNIAGGNVTNGTVTVTKSPTTTTNTDDHSGTAPAGAVQ